MNTIHPNQLSPFAYTGRIAHTAASNGNAAAGEAFTSGVASDDPTAAWKYPRLDDGAAPNGPGHDAYWTNANKDGVITSAGDKSRVWGTIAEGRLTEVYFPKVDQANTKELKFAVSNGRDWTVFDTDAGQTRVEVVDDAALAFRYVTEDKERGFKLTRTFAADPERDTMLIDVELESTKGEKLDLYVVHDAAIDNSGMHDTAWTKDGAMVAQEGGTALALAASTGFEETNVGFKGTSDGVDGLLSQHGLPHHYSSAGGGNVVQVGKLSTSDKAHATVALGFGTNADEALAAARGSLEDGFAKCYDGYTAGWHDYVGGLKQIDSPHQRQINMAAMTLKAHEDKTYKGAMIASLTIPWGHVRNANNAGEGGYHLVWGRDLYQVATAFMAVGDRDSARRALDYIFDVQQKPDGTVPQNSWLDGRPYWNGLQMDQVAFPLVLAHELGRDDAESYAKNIKPAAEYIANNGPWTQQERWEEQDGFSPSTVAAEIAGLVCAAEIADKNGDTGAAEHYRAKADEWANNLESWLVTSNGFYGDGEYYIRANVDTDPNDGDWKDQKNGGGWFDERRVVDVGFLELARLGIKAADDPIIRKSMAVIDQVTKVDTPNGPGYYRYAALDENGNRQYPDGYGESKKGEGYLHSGQGRLWPFLTGEVGQWYHLQGQDDVARSHLDSMAKMANEGLQLPEQVWDRPTNTGMSTGRAAAVLHSMWNVVDTAAGQGEPDGLAGRADLEAIVSNGDSPAILREAAQYTLDNPHVLNEMDTGAKVGEPDGLIGKWDLEGVMHNHPEDLVSEKLVFGEGTGGATPLAWTNAQFIRLAVNLAEGKPTDMPEIVARRYGNWKD